MRLITIISLLILNIGSAKQTGKLNGTWVPVKETMGKMTLPPASFGTQKLVIADSTYTFTAESVDKGICRYTEGSNKMDIYSKEGVNTGKHFTAIYKYENDQLTICYNLKGDSYPEAFDTSGNPALFMSVFKRM
ncbi:TIGR03067 domain-containing protein [Mucilaginibacter flavidus]|uniref:TIGR03067 domain-containing protein n=1 Tax=Mucilaginibacter flavidus TaxID=2949309 RepID=UPI002092771F|nr:TIGR03067 domain-containing protein [Mucilaginibacter flavidus]MCO5945405.1 TIGR03067 domain-containing protein [Mucilaginibacter flavidus]